MKQKTIRVFEVDDFEKLKNIVESKYELIKNYFFMLKEPNKEIEEYLKNKALNFFITNSVAEIKPKKEVVVVEKEIIKEKIKNESLKVFDRIIRSGEEIHTTSAVFLQKINPGAKIFIKGDAFIFGENRGDIFIDGNFLYVRKNSGNIVYNSEDIGKIDKECVFYDNKRLEI